MMMMMTTMPSGPTTTPKTAASDTDFEDPDEDHELDPMNKKMNSSSSVVNGGGGRRGSNFGQAARTRFQFDYEKFLQNRHQKIQAFLLLIIIILGLTLFIIGIQVLIYSLKKPEESCQTSQCLYSAARFSDYANWSSSTDDFVCENFYDYACGGWISKNPINEYRGWYSINDQIQDEIWRDLKHYLDRIPSTSAPDDPFHKAKMFYEKCMNLEEIDQSSLSYIKHEIYAAGGWNILGNWHGPSWKSSKTLQMLHTNYGIEAFFRVEVGADDLDPQLPFIIKILPSGLGLPRSYYFNPEYKRITEAYKQFMSDTVKIFDTTKLDASQFAENTFNYEKRIAEITPDQMDYSNPSQMFKRRFSIRELKTIAPSIKWLEILQNYFVKARLNDNTRVLLGFESYFRNISVIISTTDTKGLNDYLIWKMLSHYAPYLSKDFRLIHYNFQQTLNNLPSLNLNLNDEDRWKFCLETIDRFLGHSLSSLYVKYNMEQILNGTENFRKEIFSHIPRLILERKNSFIWFKHGDDDDADEKFINMKIKKMEILFGFPQFYRKPGLSGYYNEYFVGVKFLQNIFEAIDHRNKKWEMLLNEKNHDFFWPILPHHLRIHYDYSSNKLFVPAAMFRIPYFDKNSPLSAKFGALGWHTTANLLKAFDLKGLHYNLPDGRLSDNVKWAENRILNREINCINRQIRKVSDKLNNTVSQTYADLGALHFSWWAYKDLAIQEPQLPAIPLTNDQLFFLSFAQTFCKNINPNTEEILLENRHELPDRIRVNLLLSQSETFRETFQCPKSSPTVPSRCSPWA